MVRIICEVCNESGYLQELGNYFRVRHYAGKNPETGKAKFIYHKQNKNYALTQLALKNTHGNLRQQLGSIDQFANSEHLNLSESSLVSSGCSLFWLGHQPATLNLNNYRDFLFSKYRLQYARLQFCYVKKYGFMLDKPSEIEKLPSSIKSNVMKSLVNLSKYLGRYESFKSQLKNYGIKWGNGDASFNAFLKIVNNQQSTLRKW